MKKSLNLAIGFIAILSFFTTTTFAQTPELDQFFSESLSQVKGVGSTDTSNIDFVADFPTSEDWDAFFNAEWDTIQNQIKLNVSAIPKNRPDSEKRIKAEKSSALSQFKSLAEQVEVTLLKKAEILYNSGLSQLAQMNLSTVQYQREVSELTTTFKKSQALISAKRQEITNHLNPQPLVQEEVKNKGTVIFDSTKSPETN